MRPVTPRFLDTIRTSHQVALSIEVLGAEGMVTSITSSLVDGSVTLDAGAASRGRVALSVHAKGSVDLVPRSSASLLAPYGNELRVKRGVVHPDKSVEFASLGVFRIEDVEVDDDSSNLGVQVSGRDRSGQVIDARFEEPYQVAAGTNVETAIINTIRPVMPGLVTNFPGLTYTTPALFVEEGGDRWNLCQDLALACGHTLFFDGNGILTLRSSSSTIVASVLSEGPGGVLLSAKKGWVREGSYNIAIVTGENTGEATPVRGVAMDTNPMSPTRVDGPFGRVPVFLSSQLITTDAQATAVAQALLVRQLGTTQRVSFGALVNPALEPDDSVTILRARSGIQAEKHTIDSLSIPLSVTESSTGVTRAVQV